MNPICSEAPVLHELAAFIQSKNHRIDSDTLHQAKRLAADTIGVAFGGIETSAFKSGLQSKDPLFGEGPHSIWGTGLKSSLLGACFYNALSIRSTDFDEGHRKAVGHPASSIIPVAFSLGWANHCSYVKILRAIIIGYELATRFSHSREESNINTYSSGRWAAIGTATCVSYLLELSVEQTMHALSNAWVLSPTMIGGATDVSTGSMSKEGVAWATQSGLQSALLAKNGFIGPYLFVDAHDDFHTQKLLNDLGNGWLINSNYFKPYACCRWLHSAARAGEILNAENNFNLNDITSIEIDIFRRAIKLVSSDFPENPVQAQFHVPFVVANMLLYNHVLPEHFSPENIKNETIKKLISKTTLIEKETYNDQFPEKLPSAVTIKTINHSSKKEVLTAPWGAACQPTDDELLDKFVMQAGVSRKFIWEAIMSGNGVLTID